MKTQISIMSITRELAVIESPSCTDSPEFNEKLATLQALIGQSDGLLASQFFDDYTLDQWCAATFNQRCEIVSKYIKLEIDVCFKE
ncbi:hypothetical protein ACRWQL_00865 (plasmid) [Shewanella sp. HL-SH4]|uniref:hypothetical protein n=1 Tax=Shewanella TaxID=22 RepID=UPI003D7A25A1